jgi:hypothetical protein
MPVKTTITGGGVFRNLPRAVSRVINDLRPLAARIDPILDEMIAGQLSSEGGRSGDPYTPLAPSTITQKRRQGFGDKPILERRGDMRRDLLGSGGRQKTLAANNTLLIVTFSTKGGRVAALHQQGAGRLPRRRVLAITPRDAAAMARTFGEVLHEELLTAIRSLR